MHIMLYIIHASLCWALGPNASGNSVLCQTSDHLCAPSSTNSRSISSTGHKTSEVNRARNVMNRLNRREKKWNVKLHDQNIWDNVRIVRRYRQSKEQQADVFFWGSCDTSRGAQSFGRLALEELQCPELGRFHGRFGGFAWTWEVGSARAWTERCHQPEPGRNICRFSTER